MMPEVTETREGGLDHLEKAVQTLDDDFKRLDQAITGLMESVRVSAPGEKESGDPAATPPPSRTIIETITREVLRLQSHSERQRSLIEWIRESIQ